MLGKSVFVFRRDLRLDDNLGLIEAMAASQKVYPVFVLDPQLLERWHKAEKRLAFLAQALERLDKSLRKLKSKLIVLEGDPVCVLSRFIGSHSIDGMFINRDYTPVARRRDARLKMLCQEKQVRFFSYGDQLLNEPELVSKLDGLPYTVFTPYFRKAREFRVEEPVEFSGFSLEYLDEGVSLTSNSLTRCLKRGVGVTQDSRAVGLDHIEKLAEYDSSKDIPGIQGTARLSSLLRFGLLSVRQVYQSVSEAHSISHGLIRQLYWRDFYFQIGYHFPHVYWSSFREKYRELTWDENPKGFRRWQEGKTGFPIVDAGMRELLATGFMHNRVRMLTASFLTKNLHVDWRRGEAHFAEHLVDYDPALNNGNWQWSASTGCDAQPYFRVFNPWRQQKRFDPECAYIKRWISEFRDSSAKEIHALEKNNEGYLPKIVNLTASAAESKARFKEARTG